MTYGMYDSIDHIGVNLFISLTFYVCVIHHSVYGNIALIEP